MTDEIWRTDCRRLRSSRAAQRIGSTVSLRRCSSPEARIRQPLESDNRHSNSRRKPCCFFRRLRARTALLHRSGKECRPIARPIQPRRVRRRRSRANSIMRSHKRQRARRHAIVTDASPSFCAFARLVPGACQFEPLHHAPRSGDRSTLRFYETESSATRAERRTASQRAIVHFRDGWSHHDKDSRVGGSVLEWSFWPRIHQEWRKFCCESGRFISPLYVVRVEEHRSPEFPATSAERSMSVSGGTDAVNGLDV